jgi:squalene-hopene/tetraprenyl-beta-curcumene cyclase
VQYLRDTQEGDGSWYGRWGVNYIYGTWQVLQGLKTIDYPMDDPAIVKALDWLEKAQQPSGAWGETCRSYDDPSLMGTGEPTASQTAWATLGLIAGGRAFSPAVRNGIDYLIETQLPDGSWDEPQFTGTGFPRVFYLRYHRAPHWRAASQRNRCRRISERMSIGDTLGMIKRQVSRD